jgi:hypothetical protein
VHISIVWRSKTPLCPRSQNARRETELRDVGHHVERTEMLGSKLEIKADLGNGTIVKAAVPVA